MGLLGIGGGDKPKVGFLGDYYVRRFALKNHLTGCAELQIPCSGISFAAGFTEVGLPVEGCTGCRVGKET